MWWGGAGGNRRTRKKKAKIPDPKKKTRRLRSLRSKHNEATATTINRMIAGVNSTYLLQRLVRFDERHREK